MSQRIWERIRIWNGRVFVAATEEEHKRLSAMVKQFAAFGHSIVRVDAKIAEVRSRVVDAGIQDWQLSPAEIEASQFLQTQSKAPKLVLPKRKSKQSAKAALTVTSELPAIYKVLPAAKAKKVIAEIQADKHTTPLSHHPQCQF